MIVLYTLLAVLAVIFIFNAVMSFVEKNKYPFPGRIAKFDDQKMHVYVCGEQKNDTIVLLHDVGDAAPAVRHFELMRTLSQKYRVVLIERCGSGWSGKTYGERTDCGIVYDYRMALAACGEKKQSYTLLSFGKAEAFAKYWSENFVDEVADSFNANSDVCKSYGKAGNLLVAALRELGFLRLYNYINAVTGDDYCGNGKAYTYLCNSCAYCAPVREEMENFSQYNAQSEGIELFLKEKM